jgi:hypothetical protein
MSEPISIPDCPECGSRRTRHCGEWGHEGEPTNAWFECRDCEHQWTDFALSASLLGLPEFGPGEASDGRDEAPKG